MALVLSQKACRDARRFFEDNNLAALPFVCGLQLGFTAALFSGAFRFWPLLVSRGAKFLGDWLFQGAGFLDIDLCSSLIIGFFFFEGGGKIQGGGPDLVATSFDFLGI